jgi:hypothetical protein
MSINESIKRAEDNVNYWEAEIRKWSITSDEYARCEERLNRAQDIYQALLAPSLAQTSATPAGN